MYLNLRFNLPLMVSIPEEHFQLPKRLYDTKGGNHCFEALVQLCCEVFLRTLLVFLVMKQHFNFFVGAEENPTIERCSGGFNLNRRRREALKSYAVVT
mmetsp:Transcript_770/g.966  ORF Transcript_770/g.966 Transcript_770/m.966 type:complete len:98 (-) Transcript_770:53-346(-)